MEEVESAFNAAIHPCWADIELAESYLVCCMYHDAASLSHSILKRLLEGISSHKSSDELDDMLQSAGMVFVQSLNQLGRASQVLKELKLLFGSVTTIPFQVFFTWACFQIPDDISSDFQEVLDEFLSKWKYMEANYYASRSVEGDVAHGESFSKQHVLGVDEYLKVVELYVITFLGRTIKNVDLAISWVEKASLPEKKRQNLLRQLYSMNTSELGSSSESNASLLQIDEHVPQSSSTKDEKTGSANDLENNSKQALIEMYKKRGSCWWFRTISLKFRSTRFIISNGNIFLCFLALSLFHLMRRKSNFKSILIKQASSVRKALGDLWELAFSYQVNPLAAVAGVQSLPSAAHGTR